MDNSPVMMEKPDDLTLEQCQEAFAMFRLHIDKVNKAQKVQQCLFLIMRSQGLCHIREQIFGYLNYETLENCRKVSKLWKESLERIALVKFIEEFGDIYNIYNEKVSTIIPGWKKAAKIYGVQASIDYLEEVKDSLEKLATLNGKCCKYPVHEAARNNAVKLIEFILRTSYDMNTKNNDGSTALHLACMYGRTETAQLIIKCSKDFGIDLNVKDDVDGWTAWHEACRNGKTETAQLIIQYSKDFAIDLNAKDNDGDTAFNWACINGQTETLQMILKNWKEFGIDIKAQDNTWQTALDLTNPRLSEKIKKMLEKEYFPD